MQKPKEAGFPSHVQRVHASGTSPPTVSWRQQLCCPFAATLLEAFGPTTFSVNVAASLFTQWLRKIYFPGAKQ